MHTSLDMHRSQVVRGKGMYYHLAQALIIPSLPFYSDSSRLDALHPMSIRCPPSDLRLSPLSPLEVSARVPRPVPYIPIPQLFIINLPIFVPFLSHFCPIVHPTFISHNLHLLGSAFLFSSSLAYTSRNII